MESFAKRSLLIFIFSLFLVGNIYASNSFNNTNKDGVLVTSPTPELIPFKISEVYVPEGFDDNDNLQVVVEGFFPNGCYKVAPASVAVKNGTFKIQANAYRYYGFCIQAIVPFQQVVDLGIHAAQIYNIHAVGQGDLKKLNVKASSNPGPDDFIYAPVNQIYVSRMPENPAKRRILLSGEFTLSCLKLVRVDISVNNNVIIVLPIAEVDTSQKCENGDFPFEVSKELPDVEDGRYLVHVRTLNGNSKNKVIILGNSSMM